MQAVLLLAAGLLLAYNMQQGVETRLVGQVLYLSIHPSLSLSIVLIWFFFVLVSSARLTLSPHCVCSRQCRLKGQGPACACFASCVAAVE